jgi:hypothetical protein
MARLRSGAGADGDPGDDPLPPVTKVLTHATVPGTDRKAVVVRFGNGARLRYAEAGQDDGETGVREAWFAPADPDDDPSRVHEREAESVAAAALGAVGAYLTFDTRRRAEFVWGEANVEVLL